MSLIDTFPITGHCAAGFEAVHEAFAANFHKQGEVGAAFHVLLDGEPVVDLWGGAADAAGTRPWQPDTLVNVWSTTKGWLALAMHLLADRGLLDFEKPVTAYWPEFGAHGKERVLVNHLLTHTSGLPAPSMKVPDAALYQWETMVHALEESTLFWEPGTVCGYHAATFGWLNGEVLRRVSGMEVGEFLRTQIAAPLQADLFLGAPATETTRVAETIPPGKVGQLLFRGIMAFGNRGRRLAFTNPPRPMNAVNTARWRAAEIPSSNGHMSARGLARLYTPLALGGTWHDVTLLSAADAARACQEALNAKDIVIGIPVRRTLGFMLPGADEPRPATAVGHAGMGGSLGFADPAHRLAVGYVMNKMVMGPDQRAAELCRALYRCLPA